MPFPPRHALPQAACALALGLVLLAGAPGAALAQPTAPAPVYPENTSTPEDTAEDDDGTLTFPGRTAESAHLFLAVIDGVEPLIDPDAILEAVEAADLDPDTRIYLGVDREPSSSKSAGQLVRGLLLFGETDALADDWLENGADQGYVGDDWIVIGVILPENGGPADVALDQGRNMKLDPEGGISDPAQAGAAALAEGDYTRGLSELAVSAGTAIRPRFDAGPWTAGIGGILFVGLAGYGALRFARRWRSARAAARERELATLERRVQGSVKRLRVLHRDPPTVVGAGPVAARVRGLLGGLAERTTADADRARALAASGPSTAGNAGELAAVRDRLQVQVDALEGLAALLRGGPAARKAWTGLLADRRDQLAAAAEALDAPGVRDLPAADALLTAIVQHTNELESCAAEAARTARSRPRAESAAATYALLDRVDALRTGLDAILADLAAQARREGIGLPSGTVDLARPVGTGAGWRRPAEADVVGQLALAHTASRTTARDVRA